MTNIEWKPDGSIEEVFDREFARSWDDAFVFCSYYKSSQSGSSRGSTQYFIGTVPPPSFP